MPLAVAALRRRADRRRHGRRARSTTTATSSSSLHVGLRARRVRRLHARRRRSPALYLWQERRLKRRAADILRLRLPPLASLERLTRRTIAVSLPLLTLGLAAGIVRQRAATAAASTRSRRVTLADLARLRRLRRHAPDRAPRRVPRARRLRARDRRRGSRSPGATSHDARARRPVAPRRAGRAARAGDARPRARRRARARRSATPSASRPATAPSSTSPAATSDAPSPRSRSSPASRSTASLYRLHDEAAALHLFRVAAGLDSLVPGRGRDPRPGARRRTRRSRPGRCSTASSGRRSRVGKRVRTETAIGESPASVSSAAAALAAQVFGDLHGRRVLLIGAGRIGELAAANLASRGAAIAFVANRTAETRARARRSASAARRSRSTRSPRSSARSTSSSRRRARPSSCCRPRDVPGAPPAAALLHRHRGAARPRPGDRTSSTAASSTTSTTSRRSSPRRSPAGAPRRERAEQLVAEEAERFRAWRASLDVVPAIASLRARAEEIRSRRAREGRRPLSRRRAPHARVRDRADPEQAAAPADRAHEGGGGQRRRRRVRRRRQAPLRPRGGAMSDDAERRIRAAAGRRAVRVPPRPAGQPRVRPQPRGGGPRCARSRRVARL